jgi:hypothetical protein
VVKEKIPRLYETENVPLEEKIIYRRYQIKELGFYWLIAELDEERNLAFGYANLNNDVFAEWGYIDIQELLENGAELDKEWKPCTFKEAMERIAEERRKRLGDKREEDNGNSSIRV